METDGKTTSKRNIQPFNGEQYSIWKFRIKALLRELNVFEILTQQPPEPITPAWEQKERIGKSIIIEYLGDAFLQFAKEELTAQEVLNNLDQIYERRSLATQLSIRKQLMTLKLHGDEPLAPHFTKFDVLVGGLIAAGARIDEMEKISYLLINLPKSYEGVITALETLGEENLNLAFVKTRLLDHEVKLKTENDGISTKVLYTSEAGSSKPFKPKYKRQGKKTEKKPWNLKKQTRKNDSKNYKISNLKCNHCGRTNHLKKDCFYYKRMMMQQQPQQQQQLSLQGNSAITTETAGDSFAFMLSQNTVLSGVQQNKSELWFLLDSGATDHIINSDKYFCAYNTLSVPKIIGVAKKGASVFATKKGNISVITNQGIQGIIEDVYYAPDVPYNLLSVPTLQRKGMTVVFDGNQKVTVTYKNKILLTGKLLDKLHGVKFQVLGTTINMARNDLNVNSNHYQLWHKRLGHMSEQKFIQLKNEQMVEDITNITHINPVDEMCEACILGKQARLPFAKAKSKGHENRPLFRVHTDVCGPISPTTIDNKNYFVTFIDEFSHYTVTYLMTYKSETFNKFRDYVTKSENMFNCQIVNIYCDNGREYLSHEFKEFCLTKGIQYHLTVPYTPQLNGVAERMNRTITEKARTMIITANLPKTFWGEAVLAATYLINITPTKGVMVKKTPYELWHNKKPKVKYLKVFGATAYVHNKNRKGKFDEKSFKTIFVGYEPNGYKLYDTEKEQFIIARDVLFDELTFTESRPKLKGDNETPNTIREIVVPSTSTEAQVKTNHSNNPIINEQGTQDKNNVISGTDKTVINKDNNNDDDNSLKLRRSERLKNQPAISYDDELIEDIICSVYPNVKVPKTYAEIKTRDDRFEWEQAIQSELSSLYENKTWVLVPKPKNTNIVDCKWVFAIKQDAYGNPSKYKARLVAKGFSQQYLVDYNETFAPVARITTFRILLAFANQNQLLTHHMDVQTAFLHGTLKEDIYKKVPDGVNAECNQVCKLQKALYGLKQAARYWYSHLDFLLKNKGFHSSPVDPCLYILSNENTLNNIYLILYVDDLLIITREYNRMNNFKHFLMQNLKMVDLQEIKLFLGIRIERTENTISLNQTSYLKRVLDKFNMNECKSVNTPLPPKLNYKELNSDIYHEAPCQNAIGCLMYAMLCTRPDLCTAVNILSRYQIKNNKELWSNIKRLLRYIKGTLTLKLTYERKAYQEILLGYTDADWASDENDRKSTTGYIFKLFENCTVSWNTKRQRSVATSSTEAEYMALFEGVKEALWLKSLLNSINIKINNPIVIFEDNLGCICIANNPTQSNKSKHIDIKYHFIREQVERKNIKILYISTENQLADVFTKSISAVKFLHLREQLGLKLE